MKSIIHIGFFKEYEEDLGVIKRNITEFTYKSKVKKTFRTTDNQGVINPTPIFNLTFDLIYEDYILENIQSIAYVKYNNMYFNIQNISFKKPRMQISVGGIYNGERKTT